MRVGVLMDIDREKYQGDFDDAVEKVKFCLDLIEEIEFGNDYDKYNEFWGKRIGKRLTYEEIIGALVSAEQELKNIVKG